MGTVVGLFETRDQAVKAVETLKKAGYSADDMSILMRDKGEAADVAVEAGVGDSQGDAAAKGALGGGLLGGAAGLLLGVGALAIPGIGPIIAAGPIAAMLTGGALGAATGGIIGALTEAGVPEEEATHYQSGVERGGILLSVKVEDGREAEVRSLLKQSGLHDLKHHRSKWDKNPEYRYEIGETSTAIATATTKPKTTSKSKKETPAMAGEIKENKGTVGTATGGTAGALTGAGIGALVGGPIGAAVGAGVGAVTGAAAGGAIDYETHEPELRREYESKVGKTKSAQAWEDVSPAYKYAWESYDRPEVQDKSWSKASATLKKGWTGEGAWADHEPHVKAAWERRASHTIEAGGEAVVPIVEEELQVGKRKVEKGAVKVKTVVTEKPVEASINLHEEHVTVKRRAVNRPVTDADVSAFEEGTIELRESAEEVVVAKKARVVEEVVVGKQGSDKTHTVRDKVRKTDVEVTEVDTPEVVVYETFEPDFRKHHKTHYAKLGAYESYAPAYQFGHTLAGDTRYKTGEWATFEPEVRKAWETKHKGTWEEFKESIHHAWDKVRGKA